MKYFLILILLILQLPTSAQKHILHCGHLINGLDSKIEKEVSVFVEGNKITKIEKGFQEEKDYEIIDHREHFVLPGLIDMHVHIEGEYNKSSFLDRFTKSEADRAFRSVQNAETTLKAGFTTIRELGGTGVNTSLRDAIKRGTVRGPRILSVNKAIAITGGHADPTNGYGDHLLCHMPGPEAGVCDGSDECMKAVRQQVKDGADWIKITATAGVLSVAKDGKGPQFTEEEIKAIVATAKDRGVKVAAHAHGIEGMQRAIRGGVATIEHGSYMDEETMDLMIKHGTYYVPTITAGMSVADSAKIDGFFPEIVRPKALEIGPQIQNTFAKAYKHGVNIAFGTDAGVFKHGKNAMEFEYMVEAGMPAMETIISATSVNASVLGMEDEIGSIEVGKLADIIAVEENPIENIKTLQNVIFVMKDGKIYIEKKTKRSSMKSNSNLNKPLIHGHRGCRGLRPENSISAFLEAVNLGVHTLEMDVVLTKDRKVLVSHEGFMNAKICLDPAGNPISKANEKKHNIAEMTFEEVLKYDCGSLQHPSFSEQKNFKVNKPLMTEVFDQIEAYVKKNKLRAVHYNIEIKRSTELEGKNFPSTDELVQLILDDIVSRKLVERCNLQSFDLETCRSVKKLMPEMKLALLIDHIKSPAKNLKELGFVPDIYSPYFKLVNPALIKLAKQKKMLVIPWTVNEIKDMEEMIELGVDAIITDYPDRLIEILR